MKILAGFALLLLACGPTAQPTSSAGTIGNQAADPEPGSDPAPVRPSGGAGDRDGDGTGDANDMCPDDPEDFDGFEDEDGCPDPDNDRDGIADMNDKCPNEPESFDGQTDDDGCPP